VQEKERESEREAENRESARSLKESSAQKQMLKMSINSAKVRKNATQE